MYARSPFFQCLLAAVGGKIDLVSDRTQQNYTATVDAYRYNLDYPVTPAAIVYPESADQVAASVKCAVDQGVKVQARSGGHSYGNFGKFAHPDILYTLYSILCTSE